MNDFMVGVGIFLIVFGAGSLSCCGGGDDPHTPLVLRYRNLGCSGRLVLCGGALIIWRRQWLRPCPLGPEHA